MRICRTCKAEKPELEFSGAEKRCKPCNRDRARLFRAANPGKQDEAQRRYLARYPERGRASQAAWRGRNQEHETARKTVWREQNRMTNNFLGRMHYAVRSAIKRGELVKPTACEQCARADRRITAAHLDYLPPYLNIRWLCYSCHTTMDRWAA